MYAFFMIFIFGLFCAMAYMAFLLKKKEAEAVKLSGELALLRKYQLDVEIKKEETRKMIKLLKETLEDKKVEYKSMIDDKDKNVREIVDESELEVEQLRRKNVYLQEELDELKGKKKELENTIKRLSGI